MTKILEFNDKNDAIEFAQKNVKNDNDFMLAKVGNELLILAYRTMYDSIIRRNVSRTLRDLDDVFGVQLAQNRSNVKHGEFIEIETEFREGVYKLLVENGFTFTPID